MAKLKEEMLVQFKLEHHSIIGSYLKLQILDFSLVYMDRKLRHRPKIFIKSPRLNSTVLESKSQHQKRSLNLSCSPDTVQCSVHISSSRCSNELILLLGAKLRQIPTIFMMTTLQILIRTTPFRPENKSIPKPQSPLSQQLATNSIVNYKMNSYFQLIKGSIFHTFKHLGFQIKIIFLLSLFVMFKFYFMFYFH